MLAARWGYGWGVDAVRRVFGDKHWKEPEKWNAEAARAGAVDSVFACSMCDLFEVHPVVRQELQKLWPLVNRTPNLMWLLLTKRWNEIHRCLPCPAPANTFMGVTVENADYTHRITDQVEWLSMEPLVGPVDLTSIPRKGSTVKDYPGAPDDMLTYNALTGIYYNAAGGIVAFNKNGGVKWVVVGGGSATMQQPMQMKWALDLLAQCRHHGVLYHLKQTGDVLAKELGISGMVNADGKRDISGKTPAHWPPQLRVQEVPDFKAIISGRNEHAKRSREPGTHALQHQ